MTQPSVEVPSAGGRRTCSRCHERVATRFLQGRVKRTHYCNECSPTGIGNIARLQPLVGDAPPRREGTAEHGESATDLPPFVTDALLRALALARDEGREAERDRVRDLLGLFRVSAVDAAVDAAIRLRSENADLRRLLEGRTAYAERLGRDVAQIKDQLRDRDAKITRLKRDLEAATLVADEALSLLPPGTQAATGGAPDSVAPAPSRSTSGHAAEEPRAAGDFQRRLTEARRAVSQQLRTSNLPVINVTTAAEKEYGHFAEKERDRAVEAVRRWLSGDARSRLVREKAPGEYRLRNARVLVHLQKGLADATYTINHMTLVP